MVKWCVANGGVGSEWIRSSVQVFDGARVAPTAHLAPMQDYTKLEVRQQAHRLAMDVHRASAGIPRRDNAAFISQLRRAAQSVPTNIAEGSSKESNREFARFLQIATGSAAELHYHLQFAIGTELIPQSVGEALLTDTTIVRKRLFALLRRVRSTVGPKNS
jgi:four helix bundle protein